MLRARADGAAQPPRPAPPGAAALPDEGGRIGPPGPGGYTPGYDGTTYYGQPPLNPAPFENPVVGGYIFLAGLSGAAQLLATLARRRGVPESEGMVRRGRWLSLLAPTLGSALLIYDLHTPQRFYNMLRIFRRTSPMSIGTWILMAFSGASFATAFGEALGRIPGLRWLGRAGRAAELPAAVTGAGLGTYTAALLSATSTPLWAAAPKALAARFGASSVASGAAALSLGERLAGNHRLARDLDAVALAALALELAAARSARRTWRDVGITAARDAWPGMALERVGATDIGTLLPIAVHATTLLSGSGADGSGAESRGSRLASLAILAGSLALRIGIMSAGDQSALRPGDAFRFNSPENLPKVPS